MYYLSTAAVVQLLCLITFLKQKRQSELCVVVGYPVVEFFDQSPPLAFAEMFVHEDLAVRASVPPGPPNGFMTHKATWQMQQEMSN